MEVFPAFCDHCKALGHMCGECRTISSVPVYGSVNSANPLMTIGNEIGAVENVAVDGNVAVVSTNEVLCIMGNGVDYELGVVAAGAVDHFVAIDVGLVEPLLVVCDGRRSSVPVDFSVVPVVPKVVDHTQEDLDSSNVVSDGIENGQSVVSVGGVKDSLALEVDNMGEYNVNKVISNVSTSDLVVSSDEPSLSIHVPSLVSEELVQMVEVPVNVISNEDVKAQLALILNDTSVDHSDWLEESLSCGEVGEEVDVHEEFNAMFNLKVNCIVEKAFSSGGGKRRRRKSNRK
ncbi:hypothetical protein M5K25_019749 [Dendrobium thyrsiflorum]|uniref:Uncharacterized protein n=1 Tax=Dendrobium thyrsiflorum TaxID=117978 RepID=A0ABD0UFU2_DENTH